MNRGDGKEKNGTLFIQASRKWSNMVLIHGGLKGGGLRVKGTPKPLSLAPSLSAADSSHSLHGQAGHYWKLSSKSWNNCRNWWHLFVRIPNKNSIFLWNLMKSVQKSMMMTMASWIQKSDKRKGCFKHNKMSTCNVNHFQAINSMQPAFSLSCITITCIFISLCAHVMHTCWRAMAKGWLPAQQMQQKYICVRWLHRTTYRTAQIFQSGSVFWIRMLSCLKKNHGDSGKARDGAHALHGKKIPGLKHGISS